MVTPTVPEESEPATPDLSAGYHVMLYVNADGTFAVSGPEPHEPEPPGGEVEQAGGEPLSNIGQALKAVLQIVKDNPIGQSEQEQFEAGYASGPHRM